jgi:hypothetical protein
MFDKHHAFSAIEPTEFNLDISAKKHKLATVRYWQK